MSPRKALRKLAPLLDEPPAEGRRALLENLDELAQWAVDHMATGYSGGAEYEYPKPDYPTAIKCLEHGAKLLGIGPRQWKGNPKTSTVEIAETIEAILLGTLESGGDGSLAAARLLLEQKGLLLKKALENDSDLDAATKEELARRVALAMAKGVVG